MIFYGDIDISYSSNLLTTTPERFITQEPVKAEVVLCASGDEKSLDRILGGDFNFSDLPIALNQIESKFMKEKMVITTPDESVNILCVFHYVDISVISPEDYLYNGILRRFEIATPEEYVVEITGEAMNV